MMTQCLAVSLAPYRTNQQSLQACQAEMAKLAEQIYQASQENALLKEGLERTTFQLTQEKRLNKSLKQYQVRAGLEPVLPVGAFFSALDSIWEDFSLELPDIICPVPLLALFINPVSHTCLAVMFPEKAV